MGSNFVILNYTRRTADVYPYDSSYEPISNVPIVSGVTAYDDPSTGLTWLLIINEGLYYGDKLDHTLINPNQIRFNQIDYWDNPFDHDRPLSINIPGVLNVPLHMKGTKIQFISRSPTSAELNMIPPEQRIELTSKFKWEPTTVSLSSASTTPSENPFVILDENGDFAYADPGSDATLLHTVSPHLITLRESIVASIMVADHRLIQATATHDIPARRTLISNDRHRKATADSLAELWCIGPKRAQATLDATSQRYTRSAILPIARRYRADRMYNVKRLDWKMSTDTYWSDVKSLKQNVCGQVYTHKCGFAKSYPMPRATGTSIGHTLRDFVNDFGAPALLTFDGAKCTKW